MQQESEVLRLRTRLEQVFPLKVIGELERNPKLLEGSQHEVTILFCDLRGYTLLCERLSPREAYALVGDVMDRFTHEVARFEGVLIDYFGDGLAAFWNAPIPQDDHALLACQAAFAMCDALPALSDDWFSVTGRHLRVGIGLHTGPALVGNVGSRTRIKYGPRGSAVNLASRVQSATKQVGLPILMTLPTSQKLAGKIPTRRVAHVPLEGFETPFDLYQPLAQHQQPLYQPYAAALAEALTCFEEREHQRARAIVEHLQKAGVGDAAIDHLARQLRLTQA
jgi:adenylate cyclase